MARYLSGIPPRKSDVGRLGTACHENGTSQEHQMSAVGRGMSPAYRTLGHVAHMLLHVRLLSVIFVLNVTDTWYFLTASGSISTVGTNSRWGDGPVPETESPRGARDHLRTSVT